MTTLHPDTRIKNPAGVRIESLVEINATAEATWGVVGDFGGFQRFIPALEHIQMTGDGLGRVRHKTFKDGNFAIEQLNSYDAVGMSMTWTLIHTSLPVGNMWAAMQVAGTVPGSCRAIWTIQAEPLAEGALSELAPFQAFLQSFADNAMAQVKVLLSLGR